MTLGEKLWVRSRSGLRSGAHMVRGGKKSYELAMV